MFTTEAHPDRSFYFFLFFSLFSFNAPPSVLDGDVRKNMKAVGESVSRLLLAPTSFVSISGGINGQTGVGDLSPASNALILARINTGRVIMNCEKIVPRCRDVIDA